MFFYTAAYAPSQEKEHHPQVSSQSLYFTCHVNEGAESKAVESKLNLPSMMLAGDLDQVVELPPPLPPIRLVRYLPLARFQQDVEPDPEKKAEPAIQISIDGPKLSYQRWLVAGDPSRNRMSSLIGTWRYVQAADQEHRNELFEEFQNELDRDPRLIVSRPDGQDRCELSVREGDVHQLDELGCTIRVLSFYPYYTRDNMTKQPINLSDKRMNPAVHLEIERGDVKEDRWAFTLFPDYDHDDAKRLPYKIIFDCPVENKRDSTPQFTLVTVGRSEHEIWVRHGEETRFDSLALNQKIKIESSQYTFHACRFVSSGKLVESYSPTDERKEAVTAMKIETFGAEGEQISEWLVLGEEKQIRIRNGTISVSFGSRMSGTPEEHNRPH
jgi:hypothetical protein